MKWKEAKMAIADRSENGWNLPQTHKRHILKLPYDILHLILQHVLIVPSTAIHNQADEKDQALRSYTTYIVRWEKALCGYVRARAMSDHTDAEGQYTKIHDVIRPAFNGSVLRSCMKMYSYGNAILYGSIQPDFKIWSKAPWLKLRPNVYIPSLNNKYGREAIRTAT
ncbi:hypothetical protein DL98DRAFT_152059 [Cadophora sp. DSE1049]|nr:hypothetical protein DL98DRAFT_152059 [Cadophora sp. DSE1049]